MMQSELKAIFSSPDLLITAVGLLVATLALVASGVRAWVALVPFLRERHSRELLEQELAQGPYDRDVIRRATKYYVPPRYTNIDPSQEQEYRRSLVVAQGELIPVVDAWLDRPEDRKHLLILADSGTGKTSFVLNYYAHNERRHRRKRHKVVLVPLGDKRADDIIKEVPSKSERVFILDALDEDVKAIRDHRERVSELLELCRGARAIIMTCRTQFFLSEEEIPSETGIVRLEPRKPGEGGVHLFWKLYLAPFSDGDVKGYLRRRYRLWQFPKRRRALAIVEKITNLTVRPMLLAHIPDVVEKGLDISSSADLYELMIRGWLERESRWAEPNALMTASIDLAVDTYLGRAVRGEESVSADEVSEIIRGRKLPEIEAWQLTGRSLLNRNASGRFKFAHRSMMEYLFVKAIFCGDARCNGVPLTDQMRKFFCETAGVKPLGRDFVVTERKERPWSPSESAFDVEVVQPFVEILNEARSAGGYFDKLLERTGWVLENSRFSVEVSLARGWFPSFCVGRWLDSGSFAVLGIDSRYMTFCAAFALLVVGGKLLGEARFIVDLEGVWPTPISDSALHDVSLIRQANVGVWSVCAVDSEGRIELFRREKFPFDYQFYMRISKSAYDSFSRSLRGAVGSVARPTFYGGREGTDVG